MHTPIILFLIYIYICILFFLRSLVMILFYTSAKSKFLRSIANFPITRHVSEPEHRAAGAEAMPPRRAPAPEAIVPAPRAGGRVCVPLPSPAARTPKHPSLLSPVSPATARIKTRRGQAAALTEDFRSSRGSKTSAQRRNLWKKD